jgi:hypothetical protein
MGQDKGECAIELPLILTFSRKGRRNKFLGAKNRLPPDSMY